MYHFSLVETKIRTNAFFSTILECVIQYIHYFLTLFVKRIFFQHWRDLHIEMKTEVINPTGSVTNSNEDSINEKQTIIW